MTYKNIRTPEDACLYIESHLLRHMPKRTHYIMPKVRRAIMVVLYTKLEKNINLVDNLKKFTTRYIGTTIEVLPSKTRKGEIVLARQIIWFLIKLNTMITFVEMGNLFDRDHSTAMHGINKIKDLVSINDKEILSILKRIKKSIDENMNFKLDIGL
jgi:chromosomal replication initiation ATPase DnaA